MKRAIVILNNLSRMANLTSANVASKLSVWEKAMYQVAFVAAQWCCLMAHLNDLTLKQICSFGKNFTGISC